MNRHQRLKAIRQAQPSGQHTLLVREKARRRVWHRLRSKSMDLLLMAAGVCSAAFGLKSFLLPNGFIDGGATGVSLLLVALFKLPLGAVLVFINIPFIFLGYRNVDREFALKTALGITALVLVVSLVQFVPVTNDKLLAAIFGGFFVGAGIGLSIRGGSVLDGTEVLAIYMSRRLHTTIGDIIILINVVVFAVAAWLLSIDIALYSMITYMAASKTLDFVIEGIEEYTGVTILSMKSEQIRKMLIERMGRGVTVYKGKKGFGTHGETQDMDVVFTVVTRLEIAKLNAEILLIDRNAFIVMHSVKDIKGGMIKKRPLDH